MVGAIAAFVQELLALLDSEEGHFPFFHSHLANRSNGACLQVANTHHFREDRRQVTLLMVAGAGADLLSYPLILAAHEDSLVQQPGDDQFLVTATMARTG